MLETSGYHGKPIVAHFHNSFFQGSETFIYQYISHLRRFKPVCIAQEFVNLDQFPFPDDDLYPIVTKRHSLEWFHRGVNRRLLNRDPLLTRQLEGVGCSLLHAHFGTYGSRAVASKKKLNLPLVTSFYGLDASDKAHLKQYRRRYKLLFKEGDLFLAEGPCMRNRLIELGCPPEKVQIQRIAIPVRSIEFNERQPKIKGEKVVLMFAGRFVEKKGLIPLVHAIKKASLVSGEFELRLVGDGPMNHEVRSLVNDLGLSDKVTFLGFLQHLEYLEEMRNADFFVHPSVIAENGDSEGGAPTVILEAQASGLPIISTFHADIPNIVVPGESAILCPERDIEALCESILHLVEAQEEWAGMGLVGRRFVEAKHDIEREVDSLEDKYCQLIGS